jgi:prepilin-type processing-associated H-X9-DG protein
MGNTNFGGYDNFGDGRDGVSTNLVRQNYGGVFGLGRRLPFRITGGIECLSGERYEPVDNTMGSCMDGTSNTIAVSEVVVPKARETHFDTYVGRLFYVGGCGFTAHFRPNALTDFTSRRTYPDDACGQGTRSVQISSTTDTASTCAGIHSARSQHSGGINAAYLDGRVQFISDNIGYEVWLAASTMAGGEAGTGL